MSSRDPDERGGARMGLPYDAWKSWILGAPMLTGASEEDLAALQRGLRRAGGFALYFLLTSGAARAEALRRLRAWSGTGGMPELRFLPDGADGVRALEGLLGATAEVRPLGGLVIPDGEALLDVDGGAAMAALNLSRDALGSIVQGPLVILVPPERAAELPRAAPDLFDVRSGTLEVRALEATMAALAEMELDRHVSLGTRPSPEELDAEENRLRTLTSSPEPPPAGALADAWLRLGAKLFRAENRAEAARAAREARRLAESVGYWGGVANARFLEGSLRVRAGRSKAGEAHAEAEEAYADALRIFRQLEHRLGEAHVLTALGDLFLFTDRLTEAEQSYAHALRVFRDIGDDLGEAKALSALGYLFLSTDRLKEAEQLHADALNIFRKIEDRLGEADTLRSLGMLALIAAQPAAAFSWVLRALAIHRELDTSWGVGADHTGLALAAARAGQPLRAVVLGGRAAVILRSIDDAFGQLFAFRNLEQPLRGVDEDNAAVAALFLGWSLASRIGYPWAQALATQLAKAIPDFDPAAPVDDAALTQAAETLQAALARCEARLAEAGEDPYAPLAPP